MEINFQAHLMLFKIGMGFYGIRLENNGLHDMALVDLFCITLLIGSYRAVRKDEY